MNTTGWTGEGPEPDSTPLPLANALLGMKVRGPGDALALAAARSYDRPDPQPDPDERAANLVARGYSPGDLAQLATRLRDTEDELADELGKLERSAKRQALAAREHGAGRITAWQVQEMLGDEDGDAARAAKLEQRAEGIRRQLADAQAMIAPPAERTPDAFQAASSRASAAHREFVEATRAAMTEAAAGTWKRPTVRRGDGFRSALRPFDGGGDGRPADCPDCQNLMRSGTRPATAAEAARIHAQVCEPQPGDYRGAAEAWSTGELTRVATPDGITQLGDVYGNAVR